MDARFSRQGFLGPDSERILRRARIAIVGLGGGGSHIAQQAAHIGIGDYVLIDPDRVEHTNLNRLVAAKRSDVFWRRRKTEIARRLILGINPKAKITTVSRPWDEAKELLRDRDLIFSCVDTFACRRDLEVAARRYLVPLIDIGMDVHPEDDRYHITGQVILSMPGQPCLRCLGLIRENQLADEARRYGVAGPRPQVVWPNGVLASSAVGVGMNLLTPWHGDHKTVQYLEYDGNTHTMVESNRLLLLREIKCSHFAGAADLGNPFWAPDTVPSTTNPFIRVLNHWR